MAKQKSPGLPAPSERLSILTQLRQLKMARSAHAYVRGNTEKFYEWLSSKSSAGIPEGPAVWICGDCHIGNLGPIASAKGHIDIQIRDLDQTVIGNPAHDLIRLGLSLASAARGSDLPGVTTTMMIERMIAGYEESFAEEDEGSGGEVARPDVVKIAMRSALRRKWRHLAEERIQDTAPAIPLGRRFWPLSAAERNDIKAIFGTEKVRRMVASLRSRDDDARVEVLDAAFWVKGCSSLGRLRYAVLLEVGDSGELCLVDAKEAVKAVAPHARRAKMGKDNSERVLAGARHLSPALGDRMVGALIQERTFFLRELLPQDLKFEIERLSASEAVRVARFLANVVGKAHARQMTRDQRREWLVELKDNRTKTLDAPSWLWRSVVDLVVSHEGAYLDHCRRYASQPDG